MLNLNENFTDAAIKLFKTLLESPIQQIFNFDIGFFLISSTVKISDKTWLDVKMDLNHLLLELINIF